MAIESLRSHLDGFYDDAVFGGRPEAVGTGLVAARHAQAVVDLARGKLLHARYLAADKRSGDVPEELGAFESAAEGFAAVGDERGRGEAVLWLGLYHQVVRSDSEAALPFLESARDVAHAERDDGRRRVPLQLELARRGADSKARQHRDRAVRLHHPDVGQRGLARAPVAVRPRAPRVGR